MVLWILCFMKAITTQVTAFYTYDGTDFSFSVPSSASMLHIYIFTVTHLHDTD